MAKPRTWTVTGSLVGGTHVGEFKAETGHEAIEMAWRKAGISLCHECSRHVSDLEVEQLTAVADDGEEVQG